MPVRADARQRLGIPRDAFVVCSVGRLVADKGMFDLVEAVAMVPGADTVLLVAGDGPDAAAITSAARASTGDRALFTGWIDKGLSDVYAAADVFALPSRREAFGLVYQEAAMYGLPLIGCDIPGTRESILDGETGVLVPVRDAVALASAITRLRDDVPLRRRRGDAARARALAGFTADHMVAAYENVLRAAIS
jgi:glycosyltransferase involved in cell wall biosynthesis